MAGMVRVQREEMKVKLVEDEESICLGSERRVRMAQEATFQSHSHKMKSDKSRLFCTKQADGLAVLKYAIIGMNIIMKPHTICKHTYIYIHQLLSQTDPHHTPIFCCSLRHLVVILLMKRYHRRLGT